MMKTLKLAAVAALICTASPALAGKGGNAKLLGDAIASGSQDAILAEIERTESLMCPDCVPLVTNLLEDNRYAVREAAGWWFARRPGHNKLLTAQMLDDLQLGDSNHVRNAADYIGATVNHNAIGAMQTAYARGVSSDAKLAIVRAVRVLTNPAGNAILQQAVTDSDAAVRAAAASAWREITRQQGAAPLVPLLGDADANVRAQAATVVGAMHETTGRLALETLVTQDASPIVRRNAAWALGKLGMAESRGALLTASNDASGLVRGFAKASLAQLH